ncbi:hypothetical protein [Staphylococcus aureus]
MIGNSVINRDASESLRPTFTGIIVEEANAPSTNFRLQKPFLEV